MLGLDQSSFAKIINLLLFQGIWFLTVLGAAAGNGWIGAVGLIVFFGVHRLQSPTATGDFLLALLAASIGFVFETTLIQTGLITYNASIPSAAVAPLWLLVLWASFALTMNGCVSWLQGRYVMAAVLGGVGGPLSYFGGVKLGAATTDQPAIVLSSVALIYALVTPLLLYLAKRHADQQADN